MSTIQWLLIDGPGSGKVIWLDSSNDTMCFIDNEKEYQYIAVNYFYSGYMFRLGFVNPNSMVKFRIESLIHKVNLKPIESFEGDAA